MAVSRRLNARLRELRTEALSEALTQRQLARALGLSTPLVSSWESGAAVPPDDRLVSYAQLFSTSRSFDGKNAQLLEDLNSEEQAVQKALLDELRTLRLETLDQPTERPTGTGALGGRFLYFDDQPVTILCTPLSRRQMGYDEELALSGKLPPAAQYATNPSHPNHVRNLANGDVDSLIELVGHLRAENATADVNWFTYDRVPSQDQLNGHLILFGGIDEELTELPSGTTDVVRDLRDELETPVRLQWDDDGIEFDASFRVTLDSDGVPTTDPTKVVDTMTYRSSFTRGSESSGQGRKLVRGVPQLTSDVALIQRRENPFNPGATVTRFGGMFSRGTYGALRAFTDARLRARNEAWLDNNVNREDFWLLIRVPVIGNNTMTPDLGRANTLLHRPS